MHDHSPDDDAESVRRLFEIVSRTENPLVPRAAEFTTMRVTLPPGSPGAPPHRHSSAVFGYVVRGVLRFEIEGLRERVVAAGGSFWGPGGDVIHYQEANNLDDGETAFVVMTFVAPGQPILTPVGETEIRDRLPRRVSRTE